MNRPAVGFTLVELLVVVLIIGILAAVALPQYQKAVNKSRTVQATVMLKAITDAQEIFYLTNGEYTNDLAELDIETPSQYRGINWNTAESDDPSQYMFICTAKRTCSAWATNKNLPAFEFHMLHSPSATYKSLEGKHWCKLTQGDRTDQAKQLCLALGGVLDTQINSVVAAANRNKYYLIN